MASVITSDDLATVVIRRVIFHDVPNKPHGSANVECTLSEVTTNVDATRKTHLKTRLIRALGSAHAYPVKFTLGSGSPVPNEIHGVTKRRLSETDFVAASQRIANYLLEQQVGSVSPGLLCVVDAVARSKPALIIVKLEREEGARLELTGAAGHRTFSMSVLNNLVLTDGTRLFKTALFIRTGPDADDFDAIACDNQLNVISSGDLAKFWLRFLGCSFVEDPRFTTQRFFESAIVFVNTTVTDPIVKSEIYDHLQSQLKSQQRTFSPRRFIEDYVPQDLKADFREHLRAAKIPLSAFPKDLGDIEARLRKRVYETSKGGIIAIPTNVEDFVEVRKDDILVKDSVLKVK